MSAVLSVAAHKFGGITKAVMSVFPEIGLGHDGKDRIGIVFRDITERKQAEEELRQGREFFRRRKAIGP